MSLQRTFLILALWTSLAQAWAGTKYPSLSQEGVQQLKDLADTLAKRCPPPDCLPVFIGRSSSLIAAYWEAQGGPRSLTLPVSGLAHLPESKWSDAEKRFQQEVLSPLLDPKTAALREILVIDYVNGGQSLALATSWIADHLRAGAPALRITAAAYGSTLSKGAQSLLERAGISAEILPFSLSQRPGDLAFLVRQKMVEHYSSAGSFHLDQPMEAPRFDRSLRKPYPYTDGFSHYASYEDVVAWLKNPALKASLPTAFQLHCQSHLSTPSAPRSGPEFWN